MSEITPQHSRIGASTCERWWNCPGSVALVATIPPQPSSPYAKEGTNAHLLAEWCLRNEAEAINTVGNTIITNDGEFQVTDEMAEAVQMYLDTIRFDMETYGLKIKDIKIEHRFHLVHIDKDAYGTNDCNLPVFLDKVVVYDYKHGQGVAVDAEENKQLMYYALGAAELGDYTTIEVVIVQPRAIHRDGPIRRWTLTIEDLRSFGNELRVKIAETRTDNALLNAGPWCKKTFCPAMAVCPAIKGSVSKAAGLAFGDVIKPILPAPDTLKPQELTRILQGMPLIEAWLTSVWAYAEQKANNGETIPGFKVVKGREGNRKWSDEGRVCGALEEFGDAIYDIKLKSPSAMEKVLGKDKVKIVNQYVIRTDGKPILVPEDDPREAVNPKITQAFDNHDNNSLFT